MSHATCERVWSLTPFFNELDVLAIRLAELDDVVDLHVIAEASYTYAGNPKPYHLASAWLTDPRIAPYKDKLRLVQVSGEQVDYARVPSQAQHYGSPLQVACWQRENAQRRALGSALAGLEPHDIVLLSDVDEIPRANVVTWYDTLGATFVYRPPLAMHVGALNWVWEHPVPVICRLFRGAALLPCSLSSPDPMAICDQDTEYMRMLNGVDMGCSSREQLGWHLSYMGGPEAMRYKLAEAAHPEMATPAVTDLAHLRDVHEHGVELFYRERGLRWVPNTPPYLPAAAAGYDHLAVPNPDEREQ